MRKTAQQIFCAFTDDEVNAWIDNATIEELVTFIRLRPSPGRERTAKLALEGRRAEAARTPHWSVTPSFIVAVISTVVAILALWFAWKSERRAQRAEDALKGVHSPATSPAAQLPASQPNSPKSAP